MVTWRGSRYSSFYVIKVLHNDHFVLFLLRNDQETAVHCGVHPPIWGLHRTRNPILCIHQKMERSHSVAALK